jgi:hypothetical protein
MPDFNRAPQYSERVGRIRRFAVHVGANEPHRAQAKAMDGQVATDLKSVSTPGQSVHAVNR